VGLDDIPWDAAFDPEIVIVPAEFDPVVLFGIGEQLPASFCHGEEAPDMLDRVSLAGLPDNTLFHQHNGSPWGMLSAECNSGGKTCFVINTNFLWIPEVWFTEDENRRDMFDLNSHELGHCLGIGHVGDALDFTAASYPEDDIMSYETDNHDAGRVLCVSTLNILALEKTYGYLLGQTGYPANTANTYVHQDPADWSDDQNPSLAGTQLCPQPTASWTNPSPLLQADPI